MGGFEYDCVIELGYDVYGLMYGLFEVWNWFWGLGNCWDDLEGFKFGKNARENPDFLGSRRSAAALFLGAAALEGSAAALGHFGSPKVWFLGLLLGDTGDGSDVLFYGFRGPGSTGLVPGSGFGFG